MDVEETLVFFSQLFCDISNFVWKGKAEGSWLGPWARPTAGCFVSWAEMVAAREGPAAGLTQ